MPQGDCLVGGEDDAPLYDERGFTHSPDDTMWCYLPAYLLTVSTKFQP